eukprot:gene16061-17684_t
MAENKSCMNESTNEAEKLKISQLRFESVCVQITLPTQVIFIECCSFSVDGKLLIFCGGDGKIRVAELGSKKKLREIQGHNDIIWNVDVSSNNEFIATCSSDKTVKIWKLGSLELLATLAGHEDTVWSVKFTKNVKFIVSCSSDKKVIIWSVEIGFQQHKVLLSHTNVIEDIAISPNDKILVSSSHDFTLRVWRNFFEKNEIPGETSSPKTLQSMSILKGHKRRVTSCIFQPHRNDIIASSSADCDVFVWNIVKKSILWKLSGHFNIVWSCSFFRTNSKMFLVSASSDHSIM